MNTVILTGNLGGDMEVKQHSMEVGNFSIRVKKYNKNKKDDGFWIKIIQFKPNDFLKKNLKKGAKVTVVGQLEVNEHEKKFYTQVISREIELHSAPRNDGDAQPPQEAVTTSGGSEDNSGLPF